MSEIQVEVCFTDKLKSVRVGIMDRFGQSGSPAELFEEYGLTAENIAAHAEALLK